MKNIKLMKALTVFSAALVFQFFSVAGAQAAACSALTGTNVPTVVSGERSCTVTPTSLIFKIYELSLCTGAVTATTSATDKAALCQTLFSSSTGKDVDLTPGSVFSLDAGLSLVEGTYTQGLLKMNVNFSMKTQFQFLSSRAADDAGSTSGAFCFSNGTDITEDPSAGAGQMSCHASAFSTIANPGNFKMAIGNPDSSSNFQMNQQAGLTNTVGSLSAVTNLYILDSDSTQSTGDITYSGSDAVLGTNDRTFILADQTLATPVVITPSTTSLDIQFNVTNSASIIFDPGASGTDMDANTFEGLMFVFSAN
jgi:hypothetical protein